MFGITFMQQITNPFNQNPFPNLTPTYNPGQNHWDTTTYSLFISSYFRFMFFLPKLNLSSPPQL